MTIRVCTLELPAQCFRSTQVTGEKFSIAKTECATDYKCPHCLTLVAEEKEVKNDCR